LDSDIVDEKLSANEVGAVTALLRTIKKTECFKSLTETKLTRLISTTPVTTFETAIQDSNDEDELPKELLYENGTECGMFTMILSGKVTMLVGAENIKSDRSSWSVLGSGALESNDKTQWAPDHCTGPCRCIQIKRDVSVDSSATSAFERRIATEDKIIA
jgi:hypothetical protein